VDTLLEDRLGLIELELGLEVVQVVGVAAAVGTATGVGEVELLIDNLLASSAPVTLAAAVLLSLLRVDTLEAVLGKELGDIVLRENCALGKTSMVFLVELVRSSHVDGSLRN